jgi:hypothetical protein
MTVAVDAMTPPAGSAFGHRLAPIGDPLEGAAFDDVYEAKIKPELVKCEAQRQKALLIFVIAIAGGAVVDALEFMLAPGTGGPWPIRTLQIAFGTTLAAAVVGYLPLAAVARRAKVAVVQALCVPLGVTYQLAGGAAPEFDDFLRLRLLPKPDEKTFQDFFSGRRGKVDFAICEANLSQGSGKNRHVVFHGQLFCLSTPRRLGSTTVVLRNTGWFKNFECPSGLAAIGLEDPTFNRTFAVFGSDQVEAREILTPAFMQELNDLESVYRGAHIRCGFDQAMLLIALEGPNRFEIGSMFSSLVERSRVETIARNIDQVFKLIDQFQAA